VILGVGVDILATTRVKRLLLKFPERFPAKILTNEEMRGWSRQGSRYAALAKIFAIKEAVAKAVSDTKNASWQDITTGHDQNGKPTVQVSGALLKNIKSTDFNIQISVSDEKELVIAFAIVEGSRE
jgi:holo-[acyl-carrier protein] synthase